MADAWIAPSNDLQSASNFAGSVASRVENQALGGGSEDGAVVHRLHEEVLQ